ncbi:DUF494 family protein [Derxia gummosa]|uniref:Protein Smg homolog n=1 Tax=Derxia gummosa DSM 723 TaxID=1121388 RepID=A0A8B6X0J4_9BURK|nr:DUF494 domain-containing protein [Derxia gummosa]
MFDVLIYLFENYFNPSACPDADVLAKKLTAVGFEREEIDEALDWLNGLSKASSAPVPMALAASAGHRVYTAWEIDQLGVEAIGFVSFLESAGVIDPAQRELIIERSVAVGESPIGAEQFKVIVLMVLWSQEAEVDALILEELLDDGSPRELH